MCNREIESMSENSYIRPPNGFPSPDISPSSIYVPASLSAKFEEFRSHSSLTPEVNDYVSKFFSSTIFVLRLIEMDKESISLAESAERNMQMIAELAYKFTNHLQEVNRIAEVSQSNGADTLVQKSKALAEEISCDLERIFSYQELFTKFAEKKTKDARKATFFLLVAVATAKQSRDKLLSKLSPEQKDLFQKVFGDFLE